MYGMFTLSKNTSFALGRDITVYNIYSLCIYLFKFHSIKLVLGGMYHMSYILLRAHLLFDLTYLVGLMFITVISQKVHNKSSVNYFICCYIITYIKVILSNLSGHGFHFRLSY